MQSNGSPDEPFFFIKKATNYFVATGWEARRGR